MRCATLKLSPFDTQVVSPRRSKCQLQQETALLSVFRIWRLQDPFLANHVYANGESQFFPGFVRRIHWRFQCKAQRQAGSVPQGQTKGRARVVTSLASLACSDVKGTASPVAASGACHASSELSLRLTSLPCTSARFTVLIAAPLNISGVSFSALCYHTLQF